MPTSYSEKELVAINQLRENLRYLNLAEDCYTDKYLVKCLIARNFDVRKAEEMLRKSLVWREENDVDSVLQWTPPDVLVKGLPFQVCGYDDEGNTILLLKAKDMDAHILSKVETADFVKYRIQLIEKTLKEMRTRNKSLSLSGDQFIAIVDLEGFSIINHLSLINSKSLDVSREMTHIFDEYYPENTKMVIVTHGMSDTHKDMVVNLSPKLITYVTSIAKLIISKKNLAKIKILNSNSKKWTEEILKHVPTDVLPVKYGGNNFEF